MRERNYYNFLLITLLAVIQCFTLVHAIDHQINDGKNHCEICALNDNFQSSIKPDRQEFLTEKNFQHKHDLFNFEYTSHYQLINHIRAPPLRL